MKPLLYGALPLSLIAASAAAAAAAAGDARIKRVVVLMMENHSFDNMLGWFKRNDSRVDGLTGAESNMDPTTNNTVYVTDNGAAVDPDPDHSLGGTAQQIYGTTQLDSSHEHDPSAVSMGGFVANEIAQNGAAWAPHIMDCIAPQHVPVITTLAKEFALFDAFFSAVPGPTFPNRLFTLSGTSWGYTVNSAEQTLLGWPQ